MPIRFDRDYAFEYATVQDMAPGIRRVVARNPSPFTFHGTGTFIVGRGEVAVIDPGPDLEEHVEALLQGLAGERITHLVVTHTHRDHSPACRALQARTGAPTYGFGPHGSGRLEAGAVVEEGGDLDFAPDVRVAGGDVIEGAGWSLECVHTPGHTSNHMCYQYREQRALFCGDHVMGWSTSVIAPPDGDLRAYLASLALLLEREDRRYWPTHGPAIADPRAFVRAYLDHRHERIAQVLAELGAGCSTIAEMLPAMYRGLDPRLLPAAARSVLATLVYLVEEGRVRAQGSPALDTRYALAGGR